MKSLLSDIFFKSMLRFMVKFPIPFWILLSLTLGFLSTTFFQSNVPFIIQGIISSFIIFIITFFILLVLSFANTKFNEHIERWLSGKYKNEFDV